MLAIAIAIGFVICRWQRSVKVLKYVQRFIRFLSVHPLSLLFVHVAVCLFLFLWLFLC